MLLKTFLLEITQAKARSGLDCLIVVTFARQRIVKHDHYRRYPVPNYSVCRNFLQSGEEVSGDRVPCTLRPSYSELRFQKKDGEAPPTPHPTRVWGVGRGVWSVWCGVWGVGCGVKGEGCRV